MLQGGVGFQGDAESRHARGSGNQAHGGMMRGVAEESGGRDVPREGRRGRKEEDPWIDGGVLLA